jgi:hypothetical protein
MQIIKKPGLVRAEFDTFGEFLAYAEGQVPQSERHNYEHNGCRSWENDLAFHGTRDFAEATALARGGWAEGAQRVAALRATLGQGLDRAVATHKAATVAYGVEGLWVDEGRLVTGEPECCGYETVGDTAVAKVVPVRLNVSASGSCDEHEFLVRGAIAVAVVDTLESLGERVHLTLGASAERRRTKTTYEFVATCKEPDQPLDLDRLAFFLGHRASLRRYGFSVYEKLGRPGSGLPQPFKGDDESGTIYVPHILRSGGRLSEKQFTELVRDLCRQAGVEFEAA